MRRAKTFPETRASVIIFGRLRDGGGVTGSFALNDNIVLLRQGASMPILFQNRMYDMYLSFQSSDAAFVCSHHKRIACLPFKNTYLLSQIIHGLTQYLGSLYIQIVVPISEGIRLSVHETRTCNGEGDRDEAAQQARAREGVRVRLNEQVRRPGREERQRATQGRTRRDLRVQK